MEQLLAELQDVFRQVFDDDDLVLTPETASQDIEGWDSMAFVNLIIAIEKKFKVKFSAGDISTLGLPGQNVGGMLQMLAAKQKEAP